MRSQRSRKIPYRQLLLAAAGLAFMGLLFLPKADFISLGQNDFMPLYVAGGLAPGEDLYEPGPYADFAADRFQIDSPSLRFTRPPFYALLLKPLSWAPYSYAYAIWAALRLAAIAVFLWIWRTPSRSFVAVALCCSVPLFGALFNGQDAVFLPLILATAYKLHVNKPRIAGAILSLCAIKFHLFLTLPLLFLRRDRRPMLAGFVLGAAAEVMLSFVAAGWRWPEHYYRLLSDSRVMQVGVEADRSLMPNLHGMVAIAPAPNWFELALATAVFAGTALIARRAAMAPALALIVIAGVLISYHAFLADWVLVLFGCLLMWSWLPSGSAVRLLVFLLLTPPLALMQTQGPPLSAVPPSVLLACWTAFFWETLQYPEQPESA